MLPALRSHFIACERQLNRAVGLAAAVMLLIAAAAGLFQVLSRFLLNTPAYWSEPLVRVSLIWMVYLGLMSAARGGALIAVGFFYDKTYGQMRGVLRLAIMLSMLTLFAVLTYYGWQAVYMVRNQTIAGFGLSASWVYSAIPVGSSLAAMATIAHYLDPAKEALTGPDPLKAT
ncbi:MAG: TRAP transporter small permease [Cypionkella sp.]|nr:TRAP transporter small permease [Cypionkella sp.]